MKTVLECFNNLILLEEGRRKSYKERRIIRGSSPRRGRSRRNKQNSIYSPIKFKPFKRKRIKNKKSY